MILKQSIEEKRARDAKAMEAFNGLNEPPAQA